LGFSDHKKESRFRNANQLNSNNIELLKEKKSWNTRLYFPRQQENLLKKKRRLRPKILKPGEISAEQFLKPERSPKKPSSSSQWQLPT
jgi:hypothetical protein